MHSVIAAKRAAIRCGSAVAKYAVSVSNITCRDRGAWQRLVNHRERIKSLLVLAPAHVADKACIVQNEALTAILNGRIGDAAVAQVGLVDFGGFWVCYDSEVIDSSSAGLSGCLAVIFLVAQVLYRFRLDHCAEAIECGCFIAQAQSYSVCGCCILCSGSITHIFITVLHIGRSLAAGKRIRQRIRRPNALGE